MKYPRHTGGGDLNIRNENGIKYVTTCIFRQPCLQMVSFSEKHRRKEPT
jgi:hypothetical protein